MLTWRTLSAVGYAIGSCTSSSPALDNTDESNLALSGARGCSVGLGSSNYGDIMAFSETITNMLLIYEVW